MTHENVVAVGVDGSEPSKAALKWALAQAQARDAELRLVCVFQLPSYAMQQYGLHPATLTQQSNALYDAAQRSVKELAASVEGQGVKVTWTLVDGDPAEVLVDLSKRVALVVVGGRGDSHGSIADRLLRTVSSAVPAYAYCPTVVVPQDCANQRVPIKKIVVGMDGSDPAKIAVQRAVWEADRWDAKLTVLSSVHVDSSPWAPTYTVDRGFLEEVKDSVTAQLHEVDEGREIDVHVEAREGNPIRLLAESSKEADLVVVGTRGHGGFAGLLLGSTSQMLLELAKCPVMVVPRRIREGDDTGPVRDEQ
ncbi:MAG: universal stress protein [Arcanobacterium sp.]|nr:universal stress protein [Arcanobacterium sp.]